MDHFLTIKFWEIGMALSELTMQEVEALIAFLKENMESHVDGSMEYWDARDRYLEVWKYKCDFALRQQERVKSEEFYNLLKEGNAILEAGLNLVNKDDK